MPSLLPASAVLTDTGVGATGMGAIGATGMGAIGVGATGVGATGVGATGVGRMGVGTIGFDPMGFGKTGAVTDTGVATGAGVAVSTTEHQEFTPLLLPLQVHWVLNPLLSEPVTVPVAQLLATVPQVPLTGDAWTSAVEHQTLDPVLLPLQVHWVLEPLSVALVTVPAAQLLATEPHAPLTGAGPLSVREHQEFTPLLVPAQVHWVLKPLSVTPVTVPVAQLCATVPQVPLTDWACAGSQHKLAMSAQAPSKRDPKNFGLVTGLDIWTAPYHCEIER